MAILQDIKYEQSCNPKWKVIKNNKPVENLYSRAHLSMGLNIIINFFSNITFHLTSDKERGKIKKQRHMAHNKNIKLCRR